ncbi:hypothetical protein TNCV_1967271 [Trichonephila clavipes]|nr:hypothetical protein TNCV_1967271 [Trichonephila clavipes]
MPPVASVSYGCVTYSCDQCVKGSSPAATKDPLSRGTVMSPFTQRCGSLERELSAQVSSTSLDLGSKLRGPIANIIRLPPFQKKRE